MGPVGIMPRSAGGPCAPEQLCWGSPDAASSCSHWRFNVSSSAPSSSDGVGSARFVSPFLRHGNPLCNRKDKSDCVGSEGGRADGDIVEPGGGCDKAVAGSKAPALATKPRSSAGVGRRSTGPPRGRQPIGMKWSRELQDWVPDSEAKRQRIRPYLSKKKRPVSAPRGRPPADKYWCHQSNQYVMKEAPFPEVNQDKFKIDVPSQLSTGGWSIPGAAPDQNP